MSRPGIAAYRQIFRISPFRRFWLGFTFSALGDAMTRVALIWFVYDTTRSAEAVSWLWLCYTGPVIVGGFLAGWLLDRFDRRRVMIVDSVVRSATVALIPLLAASGRLSPWHAYAVAAVYGTLFMISLAGGPTLLPTLVGRSQLTTANALEMLSFTVVGVVGPPLAGLLIPRVGAPNVVILDAVSYAAFALALVAVGPPHAAAEPSGARAHGSTLGDAVRLLRGNLVLLSTTLMFMGFNVGNGLLAVWLPVMVDRVLGGGAGLYGALLGALALGQVTSALTAGGVTPSLPLGTLICMAQFLAGVALTPLLLGHDAWSTAAALAAFGAFSTPLTIWAQTLRMRIIPERLRGRTFALLRMLMQGGTPIGAAAAGWLLPVLGIPATVALSAALVAVPGLLGSRVRELREAGSREPARPA